MKKSVLFITAFPPNQKTAGQDYSRRLINDLVEKGYKVDLIYTHYPDHRIEVDPQVSVLKIICPKKRNMLFRPSVHPFFSKRLDEGVLTYINSIKDNYDILYFDFSQVHIYSIYINHPMKIAMCHDVICQKYARRTGILNVKWIKKWEKKILLTFNEVFTFSKKDCDLIYESYGINSKYVNFYLKTDRINYDSIGSILKDTFCFYGAWNRIENSESLLYFIDNIYPFLNKELQFWVIGGGMEQKILNKIMKFSNFKYLGYVENPVSEIAKCQALIAPLHQGAGVKVKVVDALTSGTSVLGTQIAFEGILDNENYPLFIQCDTEQDFIKNINNWENNDKDYKQNAGNEFFDRYNTRHFPEFLNNIFHR